ncbi:FtsQ-type POTRA domain-containing protein, partial [bacterium]|nr:FtsQ-type POTRA domain-containing protein [bacterium]
LARRRRKRAGARRRWLPPLLTGLVTAVLAAVAWWTLTSPTFRIAKVETSRYRFTSKETLDRRLRGWLERDLNIWTLDGDSLTREIEALPWVRRVKIGRRLPSTLQVDIWEWRPLLLLTDGDGRPHAHGLALVQNGEALPLPDHLPPPDLPLLVDERDVAPRDAAESARLLDLLAAMRETGLEMACEVDFILRERRGLVVVLAGDRGRLVVGREDFATRLQRYLDVAERVPSGAEIDLRFERQVYIEESRRACRYAPARNG